MESELKEMLASLDRTGYCQWMKSEGVPIVEGFSVEDVRELKLGPWRPLRLCAKNIPSCPSCLRWWNAVSDLAAALLRCVLRGENYLFLYNPSIKPL